MSYQRQRLLSPIVVGGARRPETRSPRTLPDWIHQYQPASRSDWQGQLVPFVSARDAAFTPPPPPLAARRGCEHRFAHAASRPHHKSSRPLCRSAADLFVKTTGASSRRGRPWLPSPTLTIANATTAATTPRSSTRVPTGPTGIRIWTWPPRLPETRSLTTLPSSQIRGRGRRALARQSLFSASLFTSLFASRVIRREPPVSPCDTCSNVPHRTSREYQVC